jgi:hypothetical protein
MKTGDKIRVNKGQIETLIKIQHPFGLFKSDTYTVCRSIIGSTENCIVEKGSEQVEMKFTEIEN